MSGAVIREIHAVNELEQVLEVSRAAWGFDDLELPALSQFHVVRHVGGLTAGIFDGKRLLGFVHGMPRTDLTEPCHHSHMLAVAPEAQGQGLGLRLKLFQREWCLEHGIRLVTWTYDPLLVKNARLNLTRLRARAEAYLPNLYGPLGGIYGDLPTDRFEVYWRLEEPAVVAAADRDQSVRGAGDATEEPGVETLTRVTDESLPSGERLAVEIPLDIPEIYVSHPAQALEERLRLRRIATALFAEGYEATALRLLEQSAIYVFESAR